MSATASGTRVDGVGWQDLPAPSVDLDDLVAPSAGPRGGGADAARGPAGGVRRATPDRELRALVDGVPAAGVLPDRAARTSAEGAVAALATPPGALGHLGALAATLAGIAGASPPPVPARPALVVAAGDHGIHAQQVSPWPQTISATVARLLAEGRAGASAIAAVAQARTVVLDVGLATAVGHHPRLVAARVVEGTRDATTGAALTADQVTRAVLVGARVTTALVAQGCDLVVVGDVGIGNTTTSAALIAALTDADPGALTGPGSGSDAVMLARKRTVVAQLAGRARGREPVAQLAAIGGAEHAALVGVLLAAANARVPVLLDGVVTDAAALIATRLAPPVGGVLLAGHRSPEPAAGVALDALGLRPLLDLELRLGEGSGALLAVPTVIAAARLLADVATLAEILD